MFGPTGCRLASDSDLTIERLSEEHAVVLARNGASPLEPGDRVGVLPNHSCVVSNLVDAAWLVDHVQVLGPLPVAARGRLNLQTLSPAGRRPPGYDAAHVGLTDRSGGVVMSKAVFSNTY